MPLINAYYMGTVKEKKVKKKASGVRTHSATLKVVPGNSSTGPGLSRVLRQAQGASKGAEQSRNTKARNESEGRTQMVSYEKTTKGTFAAIRKSLSDISRSFFQGTDKVADVLIDNSEKDRGIKWRRLKKEVVSVAANITLSIKRNLRNVEPADILYDASYEIGRFSKIAKSTAREIFNGLMK